MNYPPTIAAPDMRSINRSAILEIIRRAGPISRNAIAERLDVSLPTVMRIVDDLIAEELVRPGDLREWSGGRRRGLLEFNAQAHLVLGIDLGGARMFGAIADLGGNIVDELDLPRPWRQAEEGYRRLTELIDQLLASPKLEGRHIRGIGVGAPGITLHKEGIVKWAYSLDWKDYPLRAQLAERYHLPITVDNDVNLGAVGELWFGAGQETQNMILVTISTGIGAGIIIDGALYRGAHEASGEIGHFVPGREFLGQRFEDFGALELLVSGGAIAERGRDALKRKRKARVPRDLSAQDVFDAARRGETWAQAIVDETVDYLAVAIANLSVSFDPEVIILGGGVTRSADLLVDSILRRLDGVVPTPPRLLVSPLGRRAAAMGAIINVLHHTDNFYLVRKLS